MKGVDFLYTDVWVSMGEDESVWGERIELLRPYQINAEWWPRTGNPSVKFLHCLPAFHNRETTVGEEIYQEYGHRRHGGHRGGVRVAALDRLRPGREPPAHDQGRHGRHARELRRRMRILVALGGNALLKRGEPMTAEAQRAQHPVAAQALAPLAAEHQLVLSHGNGPQVGLLALQAAAYTDVEPYPLDVLGAETEGMIGYMIEQELGNLLPAEVPFATILTMVEVDADDPAFANPTKFVGPVYDKAGADALAAEKGWVFKADGEHLPAGRAVAGAQADLRDPTDPLAARPRAPW